MTCELPRYQTTGQNKDQTQSSIFLRESLSKTYPAITARDPMPVTHSWGGAHQLLQQHRGCNCAVVAVLWPHRPRLGLAADWPDDRVAQPEGLRGQAGARGLCGRAEQALTSAVMMISTGQKSPSARRLANVGQLLTALHIRRPTK